MAIDDQEYEDGQKSKALAHRMGSMFSDVSDEYFSSEVTPVDEWTRVVRILRTHGLEIVQTRAPEGG